MEITDILNTLKPLSTKYEADSDLVFISRLDSTEDGLNFYKEPHLKGSKDKKINNYSALFLTDKQNASNFLDLTRLVYYPVNRFTSSLIDNATGLYLTVSANSSYHFTEKDQIFIDPNDQLFEFNLTHPLTASISHRYDNVIYYLNVLNPTTFYFSANTFSIFNYILDKTNNKLALFYNLSTVSVSANKLYLNSQPNAFKTNNFTINYYIQKLEPRHNTTWASYHIDKKNLYNIDPLKSRYDLENNYLIHTQYSYVTGNEINANILTLKNQITHKNYSYRSDYMESRSDLVPNVDNREYHSLNTGNNQEKGDYGINIAYEFYNADYKFESDKYTVFKTPNNLYPYERININDLNWNKIGSIAGSSPYTSDKIFRKKLNDGTVHGEYVCTWLFQRKNGETIWLDRYFNAEKSTYANALSTSFTNSYTDPIKVLLNTPLSSSEYYDVLDVYNTIEEESKNTPQTIQTALFGRYVFDKVSDLAFHPSQDYIYYRIGNKFVKGALENLFTNLIQDGLIIKNQNDAESTEIITDDLTYSFDGTNYAMVSSYSGINQSHQYTLSFWLQSDDWSTAFGHQIMGNLNTKGFSVVSDSKITPFITIQNNKNVYVYNTDFALLDIASLENESLSSESLKIQDLYRTDPLDAFYTITID